MAFEGSKLDYVAQVDSQSLKDEAKLSISEDGLAVTTLFNPLFIDFADIVSFEKQGYCAVVVTGTDRLTFSSLGNLLDAFCLELQTAFNARVRKALFISGDPCFEAEGEFEYAEPQSAAGAQTAAGAQQTAAGAAGAQQATARGQARIEVYDDCVCLLPPDNRARRIPFAFMTGLQKGNFELTLTLNGGEQYSFIRLGANTDAFEASIRARLHAWREDALDAVHKLDGSLSQTQLAALATLMPQGVAVSAGQMAAIAPSYLAAVEAQIAASRAADTYAAFKEICAPDEICIGMKTNLAGEQEENILWFIAPSKTKPTAAVEFAVDEDTAAATFVYNTGSDRADFIRRLNRVMEAIDFHREVISLPDDQLASAENASYRMAVKRNAALRSIRESLAGRVIHSSPDAWTTTVRSYLC
ncbi:MAG: hypothetical protein FWD65_06580 [Coriobacteriia bacterium]|nr:hypothetical protein [Coriobacteriia bacterium]